MAPLRAVELSHSLLPGREEVGLDVTTRPIDEILPRYERAPGEWHVLSEVAFVSHVGTHIEAPLHCIEGATDTAGLELSRLVGHCTVVDFRDKAVNEAIRAEEVEQRGAELQRGDLLFVHTGRGSLYRTPNAHDRPYFETDAIQWMVDREIACLGVDCSGIEQRELPGQPNHTLLFTHGIPLIEHLVNLERLTTTRFLVVAVPLRATGLDASPVSVVALENQP